MSADVELDRAADPGLKLLSAHRTKSADGKCSSVSSPPGRQMKVDFSGRLFFPGGPMKKSKFCESQIVAILKEGEAGLPVAQILRKHGIRQAT